MERLMLVMGFVFTAAIGSAVLLTVAAYAMGAIDSAIEYIGSRRRKRPAAPLRCPRCKSEIPHGGPYRR